MSESAGPGPRSFFGQQVRWQPEIHNPLIIGLLALGRRVSSVVTRNVHAAGRLGREERFQLLVLQAVESSPLVAAAQEQGGVSVRAQFRESFGKSTLVSFDLVLGDLQLRDLASQMLGPQRDEDQVRAYRLFMSDLLERATQAVWDNPEIAPVGIRGRFVVEGEPERVILDMTDLGYLDEIARPGDLFWRLGAPASDPGWRP